MAARKPGPVAAAAATGDQRATLEALRDQLAAVVDKGGPLATAAALQLRQTLKDLAALPAVKGGSKTDEVRARREKRQREAGRGAAATPAPAAGRGGRQRGR